MKQESAKSKYKPRLREANRLKFFGHLSKILNTMNGKFSFVKSKKSCKFEYTSVTLSQTLLQSFVIIGLEAGHFHV